MIDICGLSLSLLSLLLCKHFMLVAQQAYWPVAPPTASANGEPEMVLRPQEAQDFPAAIWCLETFSSFIVLLTCVTEPV